MTTTTIKRSGALLGVSVLLCALAFAAKEYTAPKAYPAKTYPARDAHDNEKVTIAADPYDMPDKASTIFNLDYRDKGLLPVYLIITNDGDQPIALTDMKVQLVTADRSKISAADADDLYRKFARVKRRGDEPRINPLPLPRRGSEAGIPKEGLSELQNAPFVAKAVEPHSTQAGFVFFDVGGISQPLAGAHLYVMKVLDANGQELMFFDIPMEKYLSYRP
jgi:hypothetical protein